MPTGVGDTLTQMLPIILMGVAVVFLMIIPQRKQAKKTKEMLANLKTGDRVKTVGGLYGRIVSTSEEAVVIEVGPDMVKLTYSRNAIAAVESDSMPVERK